MKTITLASTLVFLMVLSAWGQGVHLLPGQSLSIEFNGVDGCHFTESSPGSYVAIGLGNDILGPGESVRLEMFEDDVNASPFATQTYSPPTVVTSLAMYGPQAWFDYQGLVRVSVLSGSVDVGGAYFIVSPDLFTYCSTSVTVPEPNTILLLALIGVTSTAVSIRRIHTRAGCVSCGGKDTPVRRRYC